MELDKILAQLRGKRAVLDQVIADLEGLGIPGKRGRGRPPGSMTKSRQNGTQNGTMRPAAKATAP